MNRWRHAKTRDRWFFGAHSSVTTCAHRGLPTTATAGIATGHITIVAPDKGAEDCAALRAALLFDSLAGELGR